MMKRNKLYTVNPWNKNFFVTGGPQFTLAPSSLKSTAINVPSKSISASYLDNLASNIGTKSPNFSSAGTAGAGSTSGSALGNIAGKAGTAMAYAGAAVGAFNGLQAAYSGDKPQYSSDAQNGFAQLDTLLTGGKKSKLGTGLVNAGASVMNNLGFVGHGLGALAGGILGTAGTIINNGWGYSIENEEAVKNNIAGLRNVHFNAADFDTLQDQFNQAGIRKVGLGEVDNGLFTDRGTEKAEELNRQQSEAYEYAMNSFKNAGYNIDKDFYEDYMRDYHAFGGPLDMPNDVSAVNYGFMTDYLTEKKRQNDLKNKMTGMTQMPSFMPSYALGGDLQANGNKYNLGQTYDVSEKEANHLKALGYEFTVIE